MPLSKGMALVRADDYIAPPPMDERPRCGNCGKRLSPRLVREMVLCRGQEAINGGKSYYLDHGWQSGRYDSYGQFCTLRCGTAFANAAYRAGYRSPRLVRVK